MDRIQRIFAYFQQQKFPGGEPDDPAAQFTADRAPRTGHQHHFAGNIFRQQYVIGGHRIPPQQIINIQITQIRHRDPPIRQITQGGQGPYRHRELTDPAQNLVTAPAPGGRNRQQHMGDAFGIDKAGQIIGGKNRSSV